MRIELKPGLKPSYPSRVYVPYSIYWGKGGGKFQRLYSIYEPNDNLAGFDVLRDEDVNIVDSSLDNYLMVATEVGKQILIHKAAYTSEDFYDALVNHDDPMNVQKLFQNMRDMGLEP